MHSSHVRTGPYSSSSGKMEIISPTTTTMYYYSVGCCPVGMLDYVRIYLPIQQAVGKAAGGMPHSIFMDKAIFGSTACITMYACHLIGIRVSLCGRSPFVSTTGTNSRSIQHTPQHFMPPCPATSPARQGRDLVVSLSQTQRPLKKSSSRRLFVGSLQHTSSQMMFGAIIKHELGVIRDDELAKYRNILHQTPPLLQAQPGEDGNDLPSKGKESARAIPGDEFSDGIAAAACSMQGWRYHKGMELCQSQLINCRRQHTHTSYRCHCCSCCCANLLDSKNYSLGRRSS